MTFSLVKNDTFWHTLETPQHNTGKLLRPHGFSQKKGHFFRKGWDASAVFSRHDLLWQTVEARFKSHTTAHSPFFIGKERPPLFLFLSFLRRFWTGRDFFLSVAVECVLRVRACTLLRARAHCVTFWEGKKQARTQVVVVLLLLQLTAAPTYLHSNGFAA